MTRTEAIRALVPGCKQCGRHHATIAARQADLTRLAKLAARFDTPKYREQIGLTKSLIKSDIAAIESHLTEHEQDDAA